MVMEVIWRVFPVLIEIAQRILSNGLTLAFSFLLDAAPDAMLVVNQVGEIVVANSQAGKLFGYNHEELIGRSIEALIPLWFHDQHVHGRENYFRDGRVRPMGLELELFAWGSGA
jgi:PAS domain S-box-containing protein